MPDTPEQHEIDEQIKADPKPGPIVITPRWAIHRRLYDWVIGLAERKHAVWWLFILSFAEASFFPIPPDVLLIPLVMGARKKAFRFAAWCTVASVLGGMLGYLIGFGPLRFIGEWIAQSYGATEQLNYVLQQIKQYGFAFVFVAGLTPIPYKVFTIAAGMSQMNVPLFALASLIGRGARFFMVAALLYWFGPPIKRWIDKYFNLACILFTILLVGGFLYHREIMNAIKSLF